MQGGPKRQVNTEEMLAELKRVVESSTRAPGAPASASTAGKSAFPNAESRRSQIGEGSARPGKANADEPDGRTAHLQRSTTRRAPSWKLTIAALALAGAAAVGAGLAFMNQAAVPPRNELPLAATDKLARPQDEPILKSSSNGVAPARGKAEIAPHPASSDLESAPPAFTSAPPDMGAVPVASQVIGPDGAPLATSPTTPSQTGAPKPVAPAAPQNAKPNGAPLASAPPTQASADKTPPPTETPKPAAALQTAKPDEAPVARAPSTPASAGKAPPLAETPKPIAAPAASVSNESAERSEPKNDGKKKPAEKPSPQKPRRSAKASAKSVAPPERRSTEPAAPKEAERSPEPSQGAGNPTALAPAPAPAPSVPQRFANGVTGAFGYLIHLPGALVPHLGGSNPDAH